MARPLIVAAMLGVAWMLACSATAQPAPPPADYDGRFTGGYDEVVGPSGDTAAGFSDADLAQLLLPDDIPPIYDPEFVPASEAALPDDEPVVGLSISGDARAYPAGILFTREMVNDVVGGVPVLVTWCPRCYAALVHDRRVDGVPVVFGNQGALYRGAMTWYDHDTGSIWSQPLGMALTGSRAGASLEPVPSQLATWGDWRAAHPHTVSLAVSEPVQPFSGRRPGPDHVVGIIMGDAAAAWPYASVVDADGARGTVGQTRVRLWRDDATGAIRAEESGEAGEAGRELAPLIAYRAAWLKFFPDSVVDEGQGRR